MKLEAHFKGRRVDHMLCDSDGYDALKTTLIDKWLEVPTGFNPSVSTFSGIPIYLDECPCPEDNVSLLTKQTPNVIPEVY